MEAREPDWHRLGELVTKRREQLGLTQGQVHAADGPSVATMRLIEGALQRSYRGNILGRLEQALQWKSGSVDAILAGGEPEPVTAPPPNSQPRRYSHPELGEISHPQDVQLWEATTFDEDTRVGFIFQARARRMREAGELPPQRRAAG